MNASGGMPVIGPIHHQELCNLHTSSGLSNFPINSCSTPSSSALQSDCYNSQPSSTILPPAAKTKPCGKFFSTAGCPFGETCHYLHYVPGGIAALGINAVDNSPVVKPNPGGMGNGLAHVNGYKTRLCNRFNTPEGCRFGDNCHFAHGESDLRPRSSNYPTTNNNSNHAINSNTVFSQGGMATMSTTYSNNVAMTTTCGLEAPYADYHTYYANYQCNGNMPTYPMNVEAFGPPSSYPPNATQQTEPGAMLNADNCQPMYHDDGEPTPPGVTSDPPQTPMPTAYYGAALIA